MNILAKSDVKPAATSSFSENDLKILEIISQSDLISQRDLAKRSGLSLGMVNLLLKRLATTGYIKIVNLNRRKVQYLLTTKGISEKYNRSYTYLLRTLRIYNQFQKRIENLVEQEIAKGHKQFIIRGGGDISDLLKVLLKSRGNSIQFRVSVPPYVELPSHGEIVLDCRLDGHSAEGISVLEAILNHRENDD